MTDLQADVSAAVNTVFETAHNLAKRQVNMRSAEQSQFMANVFANAIGRLILIDAAAEGAILHHGDIDMVKYLARLKAHLFSMRSNTLLLEYIESNAAALTAQAVLMKAATPEATRGVQ